jgi:hypothetical protein
VVILNRPLDFDLFAFELANITHLLDIAWKNDEREGARLGIVAETDERHPLRAIFDMQHRSGDTVRGARVLGRLDETESTRTSEDYWQRKFR